MLRVMLVYVDPFVSFCWLSFGSRTVAHRRGREDAVKMTLK